MTVRDTTCGIGSFRPKWMQMFANTRWFMVVYTILGIVQSMSWMYTPATTTTLEKRFKTQSQTIGVLMSGNEVSQIFLSLIMAYYGGRGSRPLWMAWGVMFSALSCFIFAVPHMIYGPGREALALTEEYLDPTVLNSTATVKSEEPLLCVANQTMDATCEQDISSGDQSNVPLFLIFLSQFVLGIGTTMCHALGNTYLDDHVKKTNAPLMFGAVMSLRMVGPVFGMTFTSILLRLYIDPTLTPVITPSDPRWMGAWWLGWLVLGTLMLLCSFLIIWFPGKMPKREKTKEKTTDPEKVLIALEKTLSEGEKDSPETELLTKKKESEEKNEKSEKEDESKKSQVRDDDGFLPSLKRLLKNQMLMYNIWSGIFFIIASSGHMTFFTKYSETQYHMSASGASMISGSTRIFAMVVGFMLSGYLMGKYKPKPRVILGYNVFLGVLSISNNIVHIFLRCDDNGLYGLDVNNGKIDIYNDCNVNCACEAVKYQPVCYVEKDMTFYSPCQLGCKTKFLSPNGSLTQFGECACVPEEITVPFNVNDIPKVPTFLNNTSTVTIMNGPCPVDCTKLLIINGVLGFSISILSSLGRVGSVVVNFRCVEQRDKVFAQGMSLMFASIFAFIPGPIIFGALLDASCLVWNASCGNKGNCWLYHKDRFRLYMDGAAAAVLDARDGRSASSKTRSGEDEQGCGDFEEAENVIGSSVRFQ
uniref:Solute carrier organic anion transporter family member n=1 Tax=Timema shepardi TaxID=629360 RepID=A0A7R9G0N5_TIMSH|nr:unnamed protein product [Timema shepardi]